MDLPKANNTCQYNENDRKIEEDLTGTYSVCCRRDVRRLARSELWLISWVVWMEQTSVFDETNECSGLNGCVGIDSVAQKWWLRCCWAGRLISLLGCSSDRDWQILMVWSGFRTELERGIKRRQLTFGGSNRHDSLLVIFIYVFILFRGVDGLQLHISWAYFEIISYKF